ncbi:MAG: lipoprotein signal peptidase [Phaeodactylibacter sp.]|nr:lipoprotein signal peptidase [Phaeodactylibacter sp.]
MKKSTIVLFVIFLVLFLDQALKIWVKTQMNYGDEIRIFGLDWALIHFVENNGMAFGISLGGDYGKLALSLFRIIAVGFLIYYLRLLIRSDVSKGLLVSFALILAGALGNILDSAFYGLIFSESPYHGGLAELFPEGGGYASFLHGKVVDMLYFPIIDTYLPEWAPFWGGEHFLFFKPVFNIADLSITLGVVNILLFQRSFFSAPPDGGQEHAGQESETSDESPEEVAASIASNSENESGIADMRPPENQEPAERPGGEGPHPSAKGD